jgi:hypothetical protein
VARACGLSGTHPGGGGLGPLRRHGPALPARHGPAFMARHRAAFLARVGAACRRRLKNAGGVKNPRSDAGRLGGPGG